MATASRAQRKQQTRRKILDAALQVFAEVGFEAASLAAIAKRCGVQKALVQYHFETKDKLWKAAIGQLWAELRDALPNYLRQPAGADHKSMTQQSDIRRLFKQIILFARDHPAWVGIMFREASAPGPRLDWLVEHYLQQDFADGTRFIELAQQHGLLPRAPAIHLLHIISGALTYALYVAPLTHKVTGIDMASEQSLDTLVDTLMLLLRGDRP
ncbi:MAG: TetR/AcrR family transcriptional regulator [Firmicutes bacterium]|nr:TetR/AcrR family transcriptional regulator [Bacillota bacterium]